MNTMTSALTGLGGERVALCNVAISAVLQDLLAEVSVTQTYRNDEPVNIEAVYTFPLPLDAVLLDLELRIGDRLLKGVVVEKKVAAKKYEDAIADGNSAVLLEAIEPGLFTMNVGNLLARETVTITFRYAMLLRWTGDRLRIFLPTTIATRYGASVHMPHHTPVASLSVENQFTLRFEVLGALRDAQFSCPSHAIESEQSSESTVLSLSEPHAVMDRDFILEVTAPEAERSLVLCGQDGDGVAAVAIFQPRFAGGRQPQPLKLVIVIDCSGSMEGDSMAQAKNAVEIILGRLQPDDRIGLIAFGSEVFTLSQRPIACTRHGLARAQRFASELDANLGGTEIGKALRKAYTVAGSDDSADILLVTDGGVADWAPVVAKGKKSGHRIFTVGVGSAVSEAFLRELASSTHGQCELVSPREDMSGVIVRQFERMRAPRANRIDIRWPDGATQIAPSRLGPVFAGDAVIACARFDRLPEHGTVTLEVETTDGDADRRALPFPSLKACQDPGGPSTVARLAAAARMKGLSQSAGSELALRYQLISPWTHWLVLAPRADEEKSLDMPELRKVPQTLAAGWGGAGSVHAAVMRAPSAAGAPHLMFSYTFEPGLMLSIDDEEFGQALRDYLPVPEQLRRKPDQAPPALPAAYQRLVELVDAEPDRLSRDGALGLLRQSGLDSSFQAVLGDAADLEVNVDVVASIILYHLLDGPVSERLSEAAHWAFCSLRNQAVEDSDDLRSVAEQADQAAHMISALSGRNGLIGPSLFQALKRSASILPMLKHIEELANRPKAHMMRT